MASLLLALQALDMVGCRGAGHRCSPELGQGRSTGSHQVPQQDMMYDWPLQMVRSGDYTGHFKQESTQGIHVRKLLRRQAEQESDGDDRCLKHLARVIRFT